MCKRRDGMARKEVTAEMTSNRKVWKNIPCTSMSLKFHTSK